jgi:hypothetical protein
MQRLRLIELGCVLIALLVARRQVRRAAVANGKRGDISKEISKKDGVAATAFTLLVNRIGHRLLKHRRRVLCVVIALPVAYFALSTFAQFFNAGMSSTTPTIHTTKTHTTKTHTTTEETPIVVRTADVTAKIAAENTPATPRRSVAVPREGLLLHASLLGGVGNCMFEFQSVLGIARKNGGHAVFKSHDLKRLREVFKLPSDNGGDGPRAFTGR